MLGLLGDSASLLGSLTAVALVVGAALVLHAAAYWLSRRAARRTGSIVDDALVRRAREPARLLLVTVALLALFEAAPPRERLADPLRHALDLALIAGVAWLFIALTRVVGDVVSARYPMNVKDNLTARRVQTQARLLQRVSTVVVLVVALSVGLMTFPGIRHLGASLLASAGLAGLVVGMAARPTLSNLIAGVQIAVTQPIRIDDVVVVEGNWGRIEEIAGSYVVVRTWDLRRLIVPLTYFIEHPFENWTRASAELLGAVFLYVDYAVDVDEVRAQLERTLAASGLWDGAVWSLQVTNANDRTVELRALMSAHDSSTAWDLRCHVREKLIAWLRERHPDSLPRLRAELNQQPAA